MTPPEPIELLGLGDVAAIRRQRNVSQSVFEKGTKAAKENGKAAQLVPVGWLAPHAHACRYP
jgi:hypothetical protein